MPGLASRGIGQWLAPLVIFFLALGVRLAYSQPNAHFDEFYHILAAESLIERGSLAIGDGAPYVRGWFFTYLVAGAFWLFGESIWVARLPSVLAGALLVACVFGWTRHNADRASAWAASLLLCFSALAIHHSLMARFYMLQSLCIWLAAASTYQMLNAPVSRSRLAGLLAVALTAALIAYHVQITSLIALAAIGGWAALDLTSRLVRIQPSARRRGWILAGVAALAVIVLSAALTFDLFSFLLIRHRSFAPWAAPHTEDFLYYHRMFRSWQPTFWTLLPIVAIVSVGRHSKPALYCWTVFLVGLLAHSTASWKAPRYVIYLLPFFFIPCGIALAALGAHLHDQLTRLITRFGGIWFPTRWASAGAMIGAVLAILVVLRFSPDFQRTPDLIRGDARSPISHADWESAASTLRPMAGSFDVVVTSANPKAFYYLGRAEIALSATQLDSRPEFSVDSAIGSRMISSVDSLRRVIQEENSGLIVIEAGHWRDERFVSNAVSDYIENNLERVPLPDDRAVMAFRWGNTAASRIPGGVD